MPHKPQHLLTLFRVSPGLLNGPPLPTPHQWAFQQVDRVLGNLAIAPWLSRATLSVLFQANMTPASSASITLAYLPRYSPLDLVAATAAMAPGLGPSALLPLDSVRVFFHTLPSN